MKKGTKQVFLVFLAYYFITCFTDVYIVFAPFYEKHGASPRIAGLFISVFYLVRLISRPLGSVMIEKIGMRRTLITSAAVSIAAAVGIALTMFNYPFVIFFRSVSGISDSVFVCATVAYQSMILDSKSRGWGFALFTIGSILPMTTIVPLSEALLKHEMTVTYIMLPVAVGIVCLAISVLIADISAAEKGKSWGSYREMFRIRGAKTFFLSCLILLLADGTMMIFASLAYDMHVSVSYYLVPLSISAILVRTFGYRLVSKVPRILLATPMGVLNGVSIFCVTFSSNPKFWIFCGVMYGIGIGIGYPTYLSLIGDLMPLQFHPKATGAVLLCVDLGWGLTPLFYGAVSPIMGAQWTFRLIGLFTMATLTAIHLRLWLPLWRERNTTAQDI